MDWNWSIFFIVLGVNSVLCLSQYLIQEHDVKEGKIPARHSLIPGTRQKFLYWQDFYTQTYGDFFGLLWVMNGFAHILVYGGMNPWIRILIFLTVFSVGIYFFVKSCLAKDHKPDWGYPEAGKISLGGLSHLPYFGAQMAMAVICVIEAILGNLTGVVLITTLLGGLIWIITFVMDMKTGHFDQLEKSE